MHKLFFYFLFSDTSVASRPVSSSEDTSVSSAAIIRVHRQFGGSDHHRQSSANRNSDSDSDSDSDNGSGLTYPSIRKKENLFSSSAATNIGSDTLTTVAVEGKSQCSEVRLHDLSAEKVSPCAAEDCMGGVVHFDSIDCKIGNRLFRLMLTPTGGDRDRDRSGQPTGNTFREIVFPTTTTSTKSSHHGKG